MPFRFESMQYGDAVAVCAAKDMEGFPCQNLPPQHLLHSSGKRCLNFYLVGAYTGWQKRDCCADFYSDDAGLGMIIG